MKLRITLTTVVLVVLGVTASPALAVRALPTSYTPVPFDSPRPQAGAQFGNSMAVVGDIDGDGVADVAVASTGQNVGTAPNQQGLGMVWVFSGATRKLILEIQSPDAQAGGGFGGTIAGVGDVNGDGIPDMVIGLAGLDVFVGPGAPCGAPEPNGCNEGQGRLYTISGSDGSLIRRIDDPRPQAGAFFGFNLTAPGDLNGNGSIDVVTGTFENVGTCTFDADGNPATPDVVAPCPVGASYAVDSRTGQRIHIFDDPDPSPFAFYGLSVFSPGDVTGDGVGDVQIGSDAFNGSAGRSYVLNGSTGAVIHRFEAPLLTAKAGGGFGFGQSGGVYPGDVNTDGVNDLLMAAPGQDAGDQHNSGRLFLFSGSDFSLLHTLEDPDPRAGGSLGFLQASAGDINADGAPDVLAARPTFSNYDPDPFPGAAAYVFDGATGAALVTLPGMSNTGPGSSVASPGDVNGDGYPDYFLGGRLLDAGAGAQSGRVVVELSQAPPVVIPPVVNPPVVTPPGPTPPPVTTPPDTVKPVLSALTLLPTAFRAARSGSSITTKHVGSKVSYKLSEKASVRFRVERAVSGRRVGGRCLGATPARRHKKRCTRYVVRSGSFTHAGKTGKNTFRFSGRVAGRKLARGRYRLRATATDPAGNKSALKRSRVFRIRR